MCKNDSRKRSSKEENYSDVNMNNDEIHCTAGLLRSGRREVNKSSTEVGLRELYQNLMV